MTSHVEFDLDQRALSKCTHWEYLLQLSNISFLRPKIIRKYLILARSYLLLMLHEKRENCFTHVILGLLTLGLRYVIQGWTFVHKLG